MVDASGWQPRNDLRGWKQEGTNKKETRSLEWEPAREEREDLSPEGEDKHLALAKAQDTSPAGEEGEKPSSKNKSRHHLPSCTPRHLIEWRESVDKVPTESEQSAMTEPATRQTALGVPKDKQTSICPLSWQESGDWMQKPTRRREQQTRQRLMS